MLSNKALARCIGEQDERINVLYEAGLEALRVLKTMQFKNPTHDDHRLQVISNLEKALWPNIRQGGKE